VAAVRAAGLRYLHSGPCAVTTGPAVEQWPADGAFLLSKASYPPRPACAARPCRSWPREPPPRLVAVSKRRTGWSNWREEPAPICSAIDRCWWPGNSPNATNGRLVPRWRRPWSTSARVPPPRRMHPGVRRSAPCPRKLPSGASTSSGRKLGAAPGSGPQCSDAAASSPPKPGLSRRRIYALLHQPPPYSRHYQFGWPLFASPTSSQNHKEPNCFVPCCCVWRPAALQPRWRPVGCFADPVAWAPQTSTNGPCWQLGLAAPCRCPRFWWASPWCGREFSGGSATRPGDAQG